MLTVVKGDAKGEVDDDGEAEFDNDDEAEPEEDGDVIATAILTD